MPSASNELPRVNSTGATRVALMLALAAAAGCSSSSSNPSNPGQTASGDDGSISDDGGVAADATEPAQDDAATGTGTGDARVGDGSTEDATRPTDGAAGSLDAGDAASNGDAAGDTPAGQAGVTAFCTAAGARLASCVDGGSSDAATHTCDPGSIALYRSDYVAALTACASSASCSDLLADGGDPDGGEEQCVSAALAQLTPTAAVTAFCSQIGNSTCVDDAIADCPDTVKGFSDVTIQALATCESDPNCSDHETCATTALTPP